MEKAMFNPLQRAGHGNWLSQLFLWSHDHQKLEKKTRLKAHGFLELEDRCHATDLPESPNCEGNQPHLVRGFRGRGTTSSSTRFLSHSQVCHVSLNCFGILGTDPDCGPLTIWLPDSDHVVSIFAQPTAYRCLYSTESMGLTFALSVES